MNALLLALVLLAPADPQKVVRPHATVEVLDDPAQVQDVIAKLEQKKAQAAAAAAAAEAAAQRLKPERPPLPRQPDAAGKRGQDGGSRPTTRREHGADRRERPRTPRR